MQSDITRYIIIADARTGSTFLKSLIGSHPSVLGFGELLNRSKILWDWEDYNTQYNTDAIRAGRDADPVAFVKSIYELADGVDFTCVGFKSLYHHYYYTDKHKRLIPFLLDNTDIRIIHLKRRNSFKKFCSMQIAQQRLANGTTMNAYRPDDVENSINITVNLEKCLKFLKKSSALETRFDTLLAHRYPLEVIYEDLAADTARVMAKVLHFLRLPPAPLSMNTHKVRKQPIHEVVTNYDEAARYLSANGYATLFTM